MEPIQYLVCVDLRGDADLPGLLDYLGSAVLGMRESVTKEGYPVYEIDFDHRMIRNTVAHGAAFQRGFAAHVSMRRPDELGTTE